MLPDLLSGHRGARLTARAGDTAIDGPQALLVSNNPYEDGDVAGLGRRARLDAGALGVVAVGWTAPGRPSGCCATAPASGADRRSPPARSWSTPTRPRSRSASTARRS